MSSPLLLSGISDPDTRDEEISTLRRTLERTDEALRLERNKTAAIEHSLRELRHLTKPFYQLLQRIHGELDDVGIDAATPVGGGGSKWDAIKQRNPGRIAQAIDTLLIQGALTTSQLAAAMRMNRSNCANNVVTKMRSMGLLDKTGDSYSLRPL
jgi:hypothetical protein